MISYSDVAKIISGLANLAKKIKNHELTEQVWQLQQMIMDLMAENTDLRAKLENTQRNMDFNTKAEFRDGSYWMPGDKTPFCARCWEVDHKIVHLEATSYGGYICPEEIYQQNLNKK